MVTINIQKKDLFLLTAIFVFLVGTGFILAYDHPSNDPTVVGHSASELDGVCLSDGTGCPVEMGGDKVKVTSYVLGAGLPEDPNTQYNPTTNPRQHLSHVIYLEDNNPNIARCGPIGDPIGWRCQLYTENGVAYLRDHGWGDVTSEFPYATDGVGGRCWVETISIEENRHRLNSRNAEGVCSVEFFT